MRGAIDRAAAAQGVGRSQSTLRTWERRGHITRIGTDHKGRALYHVGAVARQARRADRREP